MARPFNNSATAPTLSTETVLKAKYFSSFKQRIIDIFVLTEAVDERRETTLQQQQHHYHHHQQQQQLHPPPPVASSLSSRKNYPVEKISEANNCDDDVDDDTNRNDNDDDDDCRCRPQNVGNFFTDLSMRKSFKWRKRSF